MFNTRAAAQAGGVVVALVVIGGTLTSLQAQNDPARQGGALPTADEILAKYEQALGGEAALGKINTRITRTRRFQDVGSPEDHEPGALHEAPRGSKRAPAVDYLQYRDVGNGTKASFQFVNQGPNSGGVTRVRGVHYSMEDNVPIDDTIFMKPKNSLREDRGF